MSIKITFEPYPWRVAIPLGGIKMFTPKAQEKQKTIEVWLKNHVADRDWTGFEKTEYLNGYKPILDSANRELVVYLRNEHDVTLMKLALEGLV